MRKLTDKFRMLVAEWLLGKVLDIMPDCDQKIRLALLLSPYFDKRLEELRAELVRVRAH